MNKPPKGTLSKAEQRWAEATKRDNEVRSAIKDAAIRQREKIARLRTLRTEKEEADSLMAKEQAAAAATKKRSRAS
jgi:hypothetical protein